MPEKRMNCWEFKQCGREENGRNVEELGVCPAAIDTSFENINHGKNGGRVCWAIAGTFCEGQVQGAFADKRESCVKCDFFKLVNDQEKTRDTPTKLLKYLTEATDNSFLEELTYLRVNAGERFLHQGKREETAYIIQEGTCLSIVEKDGVLHPVGHRGKGDVVGIRALFTGEPRGAHVEAETDLHLWVLNKHQIDNISKKDPELLSLLTEIVARQFDSHRPVADREIGKYVATDIIGRGAYSLVYKAVHKVLNMPVAIKMMRHNMVVDSNFLDNFHQEAQIVASLNHVNILNVYDFEEQYKTVFIIMEYLEGESLQDHLKRLQMVPAGLLTNYLCQICEGLAYAHGKGIIHRDINPANVIVLPNDHIKILDFGLACPVGTEDENIGGALPYQAPELLEGETADQSSDIYALGITAYELLTGQQPFSSRQIEDMFRQDAQRQISDPAILVPTIPTGLRSFILKACQHDKNKRFIDANDALNVLRSDRVSKNQRMPARSAYGQMAKIILRYDHNQQKELNQLLLKFSKNTKALGIDIEFITLNDSDEG